MNDENFYAECASLLEADHEGSPFSHHHRTRWNNRVAGRGRYEGHGIIRVFGSNIHIALRSISLYGVFSSKEEALAAIKEKLTSTRY